MKYFILKCCRVQVKNFVALSVPCLAEKGVMSGLLLMGLLACAPFVLSNNASPTLILSELCYYPFDTSGILETFKDANLRILSADDMCHDSYAFFRTLSESGSAGIAVLGTVQPEMCAPAHFVSTFYNTTLITWNCPENSKDVSDSDNAIRLSPSVSTVGKAFTQLVENMRWKSIAIITTDEGWWPSLAQTLDVELREVGITPRHSFMISKNATQKQIENKLRGLRKNPCTAIIICLPADQAGQQVVISLDKLQLAQNFNTLTVFLDVANIPSWQNLLQISKTNSSNSSLFYTDQLSAMTKNFILIFGELNAFNLSSEEIIIKNIQISLDRINSSNFDEIKDVSTLPSVNVSTVLNQFSVTQSVTSELTVTLVSERSLDKSVHKIAAENSDVIFFIADLKQDSSMRLLLNISRDNGTNFKIKGITRNLEEWIIKHKVLEECDGCENDLAKTVNVLLILGCSCLFVIVLLGVAGFARSQLKKKRVTKGPYKVLLTATDFVFPQIADSRRVDEGIEAMLCCWLQQLQEFGGPEVEKPDLLQGSGTSARTPLRGGSSPNLAKQIIVDPRVRYNGDLVQMKPILASSGTAEIKDKTIDLLVLLHGLRHENLNPLIGCLAEPPRVALVSEFCARGSLQDVLQQDDIKLDWSFRLSLLTDLVRGMKYLHSTPIRVHGYLTSRNCVIDARWVLKVTDYGLPAFYESQGISVPAKTARELLWTSPELLRHASLRKKGTQPGDVYSFGIILQEVVVRGEPFCMLALTPEEIIEKIKKPPPLIRPSVSKGAAPPEAINIMRQCWAEQAEMRPDFNAVHDQFKKLNHGRKVNIVDTMFQMLEKYSNNLEELIRERTEQLDFEKKKTEQLLNRMLPSSVAEKLKLGMPVDPEEFEDVTIYFSDIVGFTTISAYSTPFQVVDLLNDLYTCFDATINAYNVYKVETIGDAYMVVSGLPVKIADHAEQIATMALDLLHQSGKFRIRHLPRTPLKLRIGLHTGPCCSGVVGLTMPRYCLFGDTVNTASRMESTGAPWRIHLSEATKKHLERAGGYHLEFRGPTEVKGKGPMNTYWLLGKDGFNKELPDPPNIEDSHGLDESLIIKEQIAANIQREPTMREQECIETSKQPAAAPEDSSKSTKPSFIRTMELSKFHQSLAKAQEAESKPSSKMDYSMVKSTSTDTPMSLGTPVSASEVAAALLGASTNSLCGYRRHWKIEEEDLSTPYNHYKSLSPRHRSGKLLRRQFSLDRTEESRLEDGLSRIMSPRLCKQNSAGAVDLEKIEEIPLRNITPASTASSSTIQCSLSISVDSLIR